MKRLALSLLVFAATIASTRPAFADPVSSFYSFAYIGEGTTGDYPDQTPVYIDITGELVIDPTPVAPVPESLHSEVTSTTPAAYEVVFGNFTFDGNLFGLLPNSFPGYDSLFVDVPGETTCCGLRYGDVLYPELGDGYYLGNDMIFTDSNGDVIEFAGLGGLGNDFFEEYTLQGDTEAQGAFIISPAPEPSSWLLLGSGLLSLIALLFANREAIAKR